LHRGVGVDPVAVYPDTLRKTEGFKESKYQGFKGNAQRRTDGSLPDFTRNRISDGLVKSSRSRLATPENTAIAGAAGGVLSVLRSDEG